MKETTRDGVLGILSSLGIFYLFELLYRGLQNIVHIYYEFPQVLEIMKLSLFLTSIPSLIVGIIVWKKMKLSREFNMWFIIALLTTFSLQIVGYLIWYSSYVPF